MKLLSQEAVKSENTTALMKHELCIAKTNEESLNTRPESLNLQTSLLCINASISQSKEIKYLQHLSGQLKQEKSALNHNVAVLKEAKALLEFSIEELLSKKMTLQTKMEHLEMGRMSIHSKAHSCHDKTYYPATMKFL